MSISFQKAVRRALPQPIWHWSHLHCGITRRYLIYMALRMHVYGCSIWFAVLSKLQPGCMLLRCHKWHMRVCVHAMLMRVWEFIALQTGCPWFWDTKTRCWVILIVVPCILILSKSFCFTNGCTIYYIKMKIYIKIQTKIAPRCFGLTTILREHIIHLS
jgi:hypothetical protein